MADTTPHDPAKDAHSGPASPFGRLVHWTKLIAGAIVGLAAVIGAVAVIVDFATKDPKAVVDADFAALGLNPMTLDAFQEAQKFESASLPRVRVRLAAATTLAQAPGGDDSSVAPTQEQTETDAPEPTDTVDPEPTATVEPEPTATADPDQTAAQLDRQYDMGRGCSDDPTASGCALEAVAQAAAGDAPDSSRAERLAGVREVLAGTRSQVGTDGKQRLMGIAVAIDVTLTGMNGQRVDLYWSIESADTKRALSQSWLRNTKAATLRPHAEEQEIQKDIWLPLPPEHGRYRARVTLVDENGDRYRKRSDVFS